MFKLMGNKKLIILMVALIAFIALFGLTLVKREKLTWPERFIKDTVSWTQGLFYKPAGIVAGFFEDVHNLRVVYEENKILKMTLSQYARDTMRLNDLEAQNKRFKEQLAFTERQKQSDNYTYRIAEVIAVSTDPIVKTMNINLGAKDGIKLNMAVVSVDGLIGRIMVVSDFTSTVQLLTDIDDTNNMSKGIAATVKGKESESFGLIERFVGETQLLAMTKIERPEEFNVGDTVVTSGLGQVFPPGLEIGTVVSNEVGEFGITYKAMIQPKASFRHLREVFVVDVPVPGR
ncbi:rod shape-determining protein MreC [Paenibacillus contaminans]|nr:rod shape-determining protein MreC [Paenibacillus contaminans]